MVYEYLCLYYTSKKTQKSDAVIRHTGRPTHCERSDPFWSWDGPAETVTKGRVVRREVKGGTTSPDDTRPS
jgi:hypothetical protein